MALIDDKTVDEINADSGNYPVEMPSLQSLVEFRGVNYWQQIARVIAIQDNTVIMPVMNSIISMIEGAEKNFEHSGIDIVSYEANVREDVTEVFNLKVYPTDEPPYKVSIPNVYQGDYSPNLIPKNNCDEGYSLISFENRQCANDFFAVVDPKGDSVVRLALSGRSSVYAMGALYEFQDCFSARAETKNVWPVTMLPSGL